jgi:allose kinase
MRDREGQDPKGPGGSAAAADVIVAADVGGTHVRVGMVDGAGRLKASESRASALIDDPAEGPARLASMLEGQLAAWGCRRDGGRHRLAALAVGFPSTVSRDRRVVLQTPNLRGFDGSHVADLMEERFGVPVLLERDVTFLLSHDIDSLELDRTGTILGIYFGTGIGNAIFLNGSFHAGKNGVAGELGHIPMLGATRRCGCGNVGCSETEASGRRLAEIAAAEFPGEHVAEMFDRHADSPAIDSFLDNLSLVAAVEINILDPDHVVVGGGITRMRSFPGEELRRRILDHVRRPLPAESLSLHFSPGDEYAGVLGGARLARQTLEHDGGRS